MTLPLANPPDCYVSHVIVVILQLVLKRWFEMARRGWGVHSDAVTPIRKLFFFTKIALRDGFISKLFYKSKSPLKLSYECSKEVK